MGGQYKTKYTILYPGLIKAANRIRSDVARMEPPVPDLHVQVECNKKLREVVAGLVSTTEERDKLLHNFKEYAKGVRGMSWWKTPAIKMDDLPKYFISESEVGWALCGDSTSTYSLLVRTNSLLSNSNRIREPPSTGRYVAVSATRCGVLMVVGVDP